MDYGYVVETLGGGGWTSEGIYATVAEARRVAAQCRDQYGPGGELLCYGAVDVRIRRRPIPAGYAITSTGYLTRIA